MYVHAQTLSKWLLKMHSPVKTDYKNIDWRKLKNVVRPIYCLNFIKKKSFFSLTYQKTHPENRIGLNRDNLEPTTMKGPDLQIRIRKEMQQKKLFV